MSMSTGAHNDRTAEINVTPLIDVLLVLLIIFMVILPERKQGEFAQIPRPNPDTKSADIDNPIVIQLKDQGTGQRPEIKINHEPVKWQSLEAELQSIYRNRAERVAFVKGDPEIEFTFVAEALDITHRAGVDRIGLIGQQ